MAWFKRKSKKRFSATITSRPEHIAFDFYGACLVMALGAAHSSIFTDEYADNWIQQMANENKFSYSWDAMKPFVKPVLQQIKILSELSRVERLAVEEHIKSASSFGNLIGKLKHVKSIRKSFAMDTN